MFNDEEHWVGMLAAERRWFYRQPAGLAVKAVRRNKLEAACFETRSETLDHILTNVPEDAVVGFGDSLSLREIDVYTALEDHGCTLINPSAIQDRLLPEEKRKLRTGCFTSDVFLSGANAITLDGKVVNIDGIGNRVALTIFGPPKVIFVAGANKLVDDLDTAMARIKGVAAPMVARRVGYGFPCGHTGVCNDCLSLEWMCRVTVVLEGPSKQTDTTVIIIGEDLGL